jgi:hypothetical protein
MLTSVKFSKQNGDTRKPGGLNLSIIQDIFFTSGALVNALTGTLSALLFK